LLISEVKHESYSEEHKNSDKTAGFIREFSTLTALICVDKASHRLEKMKQLIQKNSDIRQYQAQETTAKHNCNSQADLLIAVVTMNCGDENTTSKFSKTVRLPRILKNAILQRFRFSFTGCFRQRLSTAIYASWCHLSHSC